jgi:hypothetical protein
MISFLLILMFIFQPQAEECSRVNLARDKWALEYKDMPNYDQGATNICYGYTAAQMVDYWKRSHNPKTFAQNMTHSSPLYAAYLFKKFSFGGKVLDSLSLIGKPSNTPVDLGLLHSTIMEIKKNGMCNQIIIEKNLKQFTKKMGFETFDFYPMMYYFFAEFTRLKGELSWYQKWNNQKTQELRALTTSSYCDGSNPKACGEANKIFDKVLPYFVKNESIKLYDEIFGDCKNPENHDVFLRNLPKPTTYTLRPASYVKNSMIQLLDRPNAQPIGVSYCMEILKTSGFVGLNKINIPTKECGLHASIVIGKRTRNGRCEFLLKNTWGEDCSHYSPNWECELGEGILRPKSKSANRSFGIWMDSEELSRNIIQFTYF